MSPVSFGPSDINNPRNVPWGMVPESYWLTKVLIFDFDWIVQEAAHGHRILPDHLKEPTLIALKETFKTLRSYEVRLAMTSNLTQTEVVQELHKLNLAEDFDCIRCAEELPALKPSPALHLNVMETLGVRPIRTIALETDADGVKAAKAAGIFCVGTPDLDGEVDYHLKSFIEHPLLHLLEQMDRVKRKRLSGPQMGSNFRQ
jgi:beta-phosphoglucomutase-like phosphatase (HAD superfamily)